MKQPKTRSQMYQGDGSNVNVHFIYLKPEGIGILFNSILEFAILSDFKLRDVIIWHLTFITASIL